MFICNYYPTLPIEKIKVLFRSPLVAIRNGINSFHFVSIKQLPINNYNDNGGINSFIFRIDKTTSNKQL